MTTCIYTLSATRHSAGSFLISRRPSAATDVYGMKLAEVYWDYAAKGVIVQEFASNSVSLANKAEVNGSGVSFLLAIGELAESSPRPRSCTATYTTTCTRATCSCGRRLRNRLC